MLPIPNPIAFTIFGIEIRYYALTMITGILFGTFLALYRRKRFSYTEDDILDFILWAVPICIVGARLYYVIFEWSNYQDDLLSVFNIRQGGLAIHGAILAGMIWSYFYCKRKGFKLLRFFDFVVPSVALGQAIGRWGNYFNMEAHGTETDFFLKIPVIEGSKIIYVHPTFLYESVLDLLLCLCLIYYENHYQKKNGQATCFYILIYSIGRFFIEGLRTDSLYMFGLRTAQLISLLGIVLAVGGLIYLHYKGSPFELKKVYE